MCGVGYWLSMGAHGCQRLHLEIKRTTCRSLFFPFTTRIPVRMQVVRFFNKNLT